MRSHKLCLLAFLSMLLDEVGKEEKLQNEENHKEFDEDNRPQGTPQPHVAEAVIVEVENLVKETLFLHVIGLLSVKYAANIVNKLKTRNFSSFFSKKKYNFAAVFEHKRPKYG